MCTYNEYKDIVLVEKYKGSDRFILLKDRFISTEVSLIQFKNYLVQLIIETQSIKDMSDDEVRDLVFNNDRVDCDNNITYVICYPNSKESIDPYILKDGMSVLDIGKKVFLKHSEEYFTNDRFDFNPYRLKVEEEGTLTKIKRAYKSGYGYYFLGTISYKKGSILSITVESHKIGFVKNS